MRTRPGALMALAALCLAGALGLSASLAAGALLRGGAGPNRIVGTPASDLVIAGGGRDLVNAGPGPDTVLGGPGNDVLNGQGGNDRLTGNSGNDRINGGAGSDRLLGGAGADRLSGGPGADTVNGGAAVDRVSGGAGADGIAGGAGNDRIDGGPGLDVLAGGKDRDVLIGGRGRDRLVGGVGNDQLRSRDGRRDVVLCGSGNDVAVADFFETTIVSCERVVRPPAGVALGIGVTGKAFGGVEARAAAVEVNATNTILQMSPANEQPRPGHLYLLVELEITNGSSRPVQPLIAVVGRSGIQLPATDPATGCGALTDPLPTGELAPGASAVGNVCWQVPWTDLGRLVLVIDRDGAVGNGIAIKVG
jgi:hypothetical protein